MGKMFCSDKNDEKKGYPWRGSHNSFQTVKKTDTLIPCEDKDNCLSGT
jgi:hypothetical protein